jgi:hypothetical protein
VSLRPWSVITWKGSRSRLMIGFRWVGDEAIRTSER